MTDLVRVRDRILEEPHIELIAEDEGLRVIVTDSGADVDSFSRSCCVSPRGAIILAKHLIAWADKQLNPKKQAWKYEGHEEWETLWQRFQQQGPDEYPTGYYKFLAEDVIDKRGGLKSEI